MEVNEITRHITEYLSTVHSPGTEELELQEIEKVSETDGGFLVEATVISYVRIGPCDLLKVPQPVSFVVSESGGNISIKTSHNWLSAWDYYWLGLADRDLCLGEVRADLEQTLGPWDDADPVHLAALLLVLSEEIGPYTTLLARFTGQPEREIEIIAARFRTALLWKEGDVDSEPWHKTGGQVALLMDAMVGAGQLERRMSERGAEYRAVRPEGPAGTCREDESVIADNEMTETN
jgi:hypothetical protein